MRLAGKHAVITGGAGDIGFATARALLGEGATVVIVDLGNDRVDSAVRRLNHDQAYGISADVTRSDDVQRYCEEAHKFRGGVDISLTMLALAVTLLRLHLIPMRPSIR
jgi:3alpha(or 20beta)-hydroxysteroid dehydrogenase